MPLRFIRIRNVHPYNTNQTDMAFALQNRGRLWRSPTFLFSLLTTDKRDCQALKQCSPRLHWQFPRRCGNEAHPLLTSMPPYESLKSKPG